MGTSPRIDVAAVRLEAILDLREEYRRELASQIVHDSWHRRGFTTSYVFHVDGGVAGYGSVGGAPRESRDTVKELYLLPPFRDDASTFFRSLVAASGARTVEAQTNDPFLAPLLRAFATDVSRPTFLFDEGHASALARPGVSFRRLTAADRARVFSHEREGVGEYGLVERGEVVATGGFLTHYNPPYADLYLEVAAPARRRGLGSYLVQELKRACRDAGLTPAARCDAVNVASRRTLERAGMRRCGHILRGTIMERATGTPCAREDSNLRPTD